jgi:hypothetical protein
MLAKYDRLDSAGRVVPRLTGKTFYYTLEDGTNYECLSVQGRPAVAPPLLDSAEPKWRAKPRSFGTSFDHTVITRRASVRVAVSKRPFRIHLESASYDWIGLARTTRNGFDSR